MKSDRDQVTDKLPGNVAEGELLWQPSHAFARRSQIARYMRWLRDRSIGDVADDAALWRWSTSEPEAFWASIGRYFDVWSSRPYRRVLDQRRMQGAKWFEGSQVNYAEHVLRRE